MALIEDERPVEFLYRVDFRCHGDDWDAPCVPIAVKHRIVRKTAGRIYVEREPFREDREKAGTTIIVNRAILNRKGRWSHPWKSETFYATEEGAMRAAHELSMGAPSWCSTLGVQLPCSIDDVKAAYRKLAKDVHPDVGGDPAAFVELERAYRVALDYCDRG